MYVRRLCTVSGEIVGKTAEKEDWIEGLGMERSLFLIKGRGQRMGDWESS